MSSPTVSVIVPAYNAADCIDAALASALDQTWRDLEVVVVDDASSDATAAVVRAWSERDARVRLVRAGINGGPARARNLGIDRSAGPWIALLDADDRFERGRIERLLAFAERTGADLIADNLRFVDATTGRALGTALPENGADEPEVVSAEAFVRRNMFGREGFDFGYLKPLIRRRALDRAGIRYPEDVRIGEDYHLYLDCLIAGARMVVTREPGYDYVLAPGSISRRLSAEAVGKLEERNRHLLERGVALPRGLRAALQERAQVLRRMAGHVRFVDLIKSGRWVDAIALLARRPDVLPLVVKYGRESVLKRLGLLDFHGRRA